MNRRLTFACLLASTMLAAPVVAQTTTQPGGATGTMSTTQPTTGTTGTMSTTQPTTGAAGTMSTTQPAPMSTAGSAQPIAAPQPGQMLASDLRGTRVYGANDENIGDISDLVLDRDGRVAAVIVGVGGFLGIGQKDVAIPFQAIEVVADNRTAGAGTGAGMTGAGGTAGTGTTGAGGTMGTAGTGPATTGAVGGTGATAGAAGAQQGTVNPSRIVLRGMTKADLENAPTFRSDGRGNTGTTGTGAAGTAPRQ